MPDTTDGCPNYREDLPSSRAGPPVVRRVPRSFTWLAGRGRRRVGGVWKSVGTLPRRAGRDQVAVRSARRAVFNPVRCLIRSWEAPAPSTVTSRSPRQLAGACSTAAGDRRGAPAIDVRQPIVDIRPCRLSRRNGHKRLGVRRCGRAFGSSVQKLLTVAALARVACHRHGTALSDTGHGLRQRASAARRSGRRTG